jgi:hypothetical protein
MLSARAVKTELSPGGIYGFTQLLHPGGEGVLTGFAGSRRARRLYRIPRRCRVIRYLWWGRLSLVKVTQRSGMMIDVTQRRDVRATGTRYNHSVPGPM